MSPTFKTIAKKWARLLWYLLFFLLTCHSMGRAHGWSFAFWLCSAAFVYNKCTEAFRDL